MMTTELIERLQARVKEYGDLPCVILVKGAEGTTMAVAKQTAHARIPIMGPIGECVVILAEKKSQVDTVFA
jgi:hypothetical protein